MKILVLGDRITDQYTFCDATRLCPEAPAPVLVPSSEKTSEGGAALVTANLQSLHGVPGHIQSAYGSVSLKHRIFAGRHLICRVDRDKESLASKKGYWNTILSHLMLPLDAVIVSDYGKGSMSEEIARGVVATCAQKSIPVFVDAKAGVEFYAGCFALFPNQHEHKNINGINYTHIVRKLGSKGCSVDGQLVPTTSQQVYDETGAGDVFIAAFVLHYMHTQDLIQAARFANAAAGVSVRHLGTYIVKPEEVKELWVSPKPQSTMMAKEEVLTKEKSQTTN